MNLSTTGYLPVASGAELSQPRRFTMGNRSPQVNLAAQRMQARGLQSLPLINKLQQWSDHRKEVRESLFSSNAFVRLSDATNNRTPVRRTHDMGMLWDRKAATAVW